MLGDLGWCASPPPDLDADFAAILGHGSVAPAFQPLRDEYGTLDTLLASLNAADEPPEPPEPPEDRSESGTCGALGKTDLKRLRNKEAARRSRAKKAAARAAVKEQQQTTAALELQRPLMAKRSEIEVLTQRKMELIALLRATRGMCSA